MGDVYEDCGMGAVEDQFGDKMTDWPEYFNIENVPEVPRAEYKPKPKLKNFTSVN